MLSYCLKYRKNPENKNLRVANPKRRKPMLLSQCAVCESKKSRFITEQKASWLFSSLGIIPPLSQIPLVGPLLSWRYKINEIIDKYLLAADKFMPEMHLRHTALKVFKKRSFFWSVFSCIWSEYWDLRSKSLHSVQIPEITDQKNSVCGQYSPSGSLDLVAVFVDHLLKTRLN